jgi:hypothetical protein
MGWICGWDGGGEACTQSFGGETSQGNVLMEDREDRAVTLRWMENRL